MKNILIVIVAITVGLVSCKFKNDFCGDRELQALELAPVNAEIKLPAYQIVDSTIYGPGRTILNYEVKSIDSLLHVFIMVDDYREYSDTQLNLHRIQALQKKEVESGKNVVQLLTDKIINTNGSQIGYLKYQVKQSSGSLIVSRIFFYEEKKLVVIWVHDTRTSGRTKDTSLSDCILKSLTFKK